MPSETIWSHSGTGTSSNTSPHQSSTNLHYMTVLDQVDPEVTKFFNTERRFSLNDGSDIDGSFFGIKKGSLSAITAPAGNSGSVNGQSTQTNRINFGTASISAGIPSRHPPQESFLQKFSTVAEATREIELLNGLSKLGLENPSSRRTSFNSESTKPKFGDIRLSPHGSLNENLNQLRHQSISEKIDQYNSKSPIQATATLSVNSDLNDNSKTVPHNFWNPATATSFTPGMYSYSGFHGGLGPIPPAVPPAIPPGQVPNEFGPYRSGSVPPFMVPSPPPPQFIDPEFYAQMNYGMQGDNAEGDEKPEESNTEAVKDKEKDKKGHPGAGGVGLMNSPQYAPPASYMFHPFNHYQMYPPFPPHPNASTLPTPELYESSPASKASPPPPPPQPVPAAKRKSGRTGKDVGKGGNHIYRSPLLEEVRANSKNKEYYLKDIYGHAVEFTKDQYGSRFIQQKLAGASAEEKEVIFNEIRGIAYELMTDVFGNYVIQKYFEHGSKMQKEVLLDATKGHIQELSLQMYGCRVIQRALEEIDVESQVRIAEELRDHVFVCLKDQNGNHVIQKSIERIPFNRVRFILDSLKDQIYHLSTHPYGCRVIQRLLEFSDEKDQENILAELSRFIFYLIQDQYGNYVMQHILERGDAKNREEILQVVLGSVVNFSKHKFASNVIEKCIKYGTLEQRKRILHEVMLGNEDLNVEVVNDDLPLALMMKDQFANYVIQKLVEGFDSRSEEKRTLVVKLRQYLKQISSKNSYGKHLASVEKMIIVAETALIEADNK